MDITPENAGLSVIQFETSPAVPIHNESPSLKIELIVLFESVVGIIGFIHNVVERLLVEVEMIDSLFQFLSIHFRLYL